MSEKFEFRAVFNLSTIKYIAANIHNIYPDFKKEQFIAETFEDFEELSFGDRNSKITKTLFHYLPKSYPEALTILVASLGEPINGEELEGYDGFYVMPLSTYIRNYGTAYYEISVNALIEMTTRFTSEFAIRLFLEQEEEKTLKQLQLCATHKNCHVRRLVSEGTRPRLPLGSRLHSFIKDPQPVLELLERLKNEPTRLVQRSIANNLNDIAKDNPDAVVSFLTRWQKEKVKDVEWIIKHATRTLIKEGHPGALRLLGFDPDIKIGNASLKVMTPQVILGEHLVFEVVIDFKNSDPQKVVVDYLLYFKKANGTLKPKVFKLSTQEISANTLLKRSKKHPLKPATTRQYYEGLQAVQLQVNGRLVGEQVAFELKL